MPLTDTAIRAAKPKAKPYKLADANSLYLLITPTGAKCWRYDYRFSGRRKSLSVGTYPDMTLAGARRERDAARDMIVAGEDPCHQRKLEKMTKKLCGGNAFRLVSDEWLEKQKREGRAQVTIDKLTWILGFANALIGDRSVSEVKAQDLLWVLRKLEVRGKFETARRGISRFLAGSVWRYQDNKIHDYVLSPGR